MFMLIPFCHYVINLDKKYYIIIDKEFARGLSLDAQERSNTGMHLMHSAHARNLFTTILMLGCY
jgi:hypothetical protein